MVDKRARARIIPECHSVYEEPLLASFVQKH